MMTARLLLVLGFAAGITVLASAQAPSSKPPGKAAPKPLRQAQEGQRIFNQNCSRCHSAPDGFSPRISGTIVRHMRVRASLSKADEQELLRFFNP